MTGTKGKRDYFYSVKVPPTSTKLLLNQRVGCLRCIANVLYINYLCNVLKSTYILDTIFATETGNVSQGNIGSESTLSLYIPLPPYPEQERIVKALNELVLTLYGIDNCRGKLQETIQNAKSKILDLAMQGKLVPQDPADEPAADMLRRINPKAKIITDNPQYQQLPKSWALTTVDSVCCYGKCQTVAVSDIQNDDWTLELEDLESYTGRLLQIKTKKDRPLSGVRHTFCAGDILFSKLRTYLNKVLIPQKDGFCSTEIVPITPFNCINTEYLYYWLRSPFFVEYSNSCGYGVKMPRLSTSDACRGIVPLPPYSEQCRIVEAINDCNKILEQITLSLS